MDDEGERIIEKVNSRMQGRFTRETAEVELNRLLTELKNPTLPVKEKAFLAAAIGALYREYGFDLYSEIPLLLKFMDLVVRSEETYFSAAVYPISVLTDKDEDSRELIFLGLYAGLRNVDPFQQYGSVLAIRFLARQQDDVSNFLSDMLRLFEVLRIELIHADQLRQKLLVALIESLGAMSENGLLLGNEAQDRLYSCLKGIPENNYGEILGKSIIKTLASMLKNGEDLSATINDMEKRFSSSVGTEKNLIILELGYLADCSNNQPLKDKISALKKN